MDERTVPRLIAGIGRALDLSGGEYSVGDVVREILAGGAQSWERDGSWVVTRVVDTPRVRSLHFWLATGEREVLVAMQREILAWGRSVGCTRATMLGRAGWRKVLEPEGWKLSPLIVMERELGNGQG
jgi:hypothetical protein